LCLKLEIIISVIQWLKRFLSELENLREEVVRRPNIKSSKINQPFVYQLHVTWEIKSKQRKIHLKLKEYHCLEDLRQEELPGIFEN
jgi:hypothetical protein